MQRRRYLRAVGGGVGAVSLSGCAELVPGEGQTPAYPGGTLVVENTGDAPVRVSVDTELDQYDATADTDVSGGHTVVRRELVTAEQGDVVTLQAQLGGTGDRISFQFLPTGGETAPPEVARLTFENAVGASAMWTATEGRYGSDLLLASVYAYSYAGSPESHPPKYRREPVTPWTRAYRASSALQRVR